MGPSGEAGSSRLRCLWVAGGGVPWALPSLLWVIRSRQGISKQGGRTRVSRHVSSVQQYTAQRTVTRKRVPGRKRRGGKAQKSPGWKAAQRADLRPPRTPKGASGRGGKLPASRVSSASLGARPRCTCHSALLSAGPRASPERVRRGGGHHFVLGGLLISFQPAPYARKTDKEGPGSLGQCASPHSAHLIGVKLHFTAFAPSSRDPLGFLHLSLSEGESDTLRKRAGSGFKPAFPPAPQSAHL